MKDRKNTLTAAILASILFCTALSSCKSTSDSPKTAPQSSTITDEQIYKDVYLSQIEYYEELIKELEDKLLKERENGYINDTAYQLQIDKLQSDIAILTEKLEGFSGNQSDTSSHPPITVSTDSEPVTENNIYNNEENRPANESLLSMGAYKYEITNGSTTIIAYIGSDRTISIPSSIDGAKVTSIGEGAFKNCSAERIIIPDSVTSIDWFAFYGCTRLCEITIPSSVTSISHGAFDLCPENIIIKCKKNSYAEVYAKSWGLIAVTE